MIKANLNNPICRVAPTPSKTWLARPHVLRKRWFYGASGDSLTRRCNRGGSESRPEKISSAGAAVAILTGVNRNFLHFLAALIFVTPAATAQNWSVGGGIGPFVFGHFVEKTSVVGTEQGTSTTTSNLSAATRPGVAADIERDFGRWLGVRLGASWTYAPLRASGVNLEAAHIGVTTFVLPVVLNLNRGDFRVHLMAGPAYALYHGNARGGGATSFPLFNGTRGRAGGMAGGGVAWWLSNRFGLEGEISDTVTASPFRLADLPSAKGVRIVKPQNVHTTVGIRYRF